MTIASSFEGSSPIEASRWQVSRKLNPASTSRRVRSVATKVVFPELPLASAQILTIKPPTYSCSRDRPKQQGVILFSRPKRPRLHRTPFSEPRFSALSEKFTGSNPFTQERLNHGLGPLCENIDRKFAMLVNPLFSWCCTAQQGHFFGAQSAKSVDRYTHRNEAHFHEPCCRQDMGN